MTQLNKKVAKPQKMGMSYEGNVQPVKAEHQQLMELVVGTLYLKDRFYEDGKDALNRLKSLVHNLVRDNQNDYIANLILATRKEFNMRTMPMVLAVEWTAALRANKKEYPHVRNVVANLISRADELSEVYSYALTVFGDKKKVPLAIKKGVADAFNKFDTYQFGKYNRDGNVTLKQLLRIVHPVAKDEAQGVIFEKIMKETLESPYTWEVELTKNGQLPEGERKTKGALWKELFTSGKMGYMATIRNVRNMVTAWNEDLNKAQASELVDQLCKYLSDEGNVRKSKMLYNQFFTAEEQVRGLPFGNKIADAIVDAIEHSVQNIPLFAERPWIIVDTSGSMSSNYGLGNKSAVMVASQFAAAVYKRFSKHSSHSALTVFGDYGKHISVRGSDSIPTIADKIRGTSVGYGTQLGAALQMQSSLGFEPDAVIIFSDMQVTSLRGTNTKFPGKMKVAFNLAAYPTTPCSSRDGWIQLTGFSDGVFRYLEGSGKADGLVKALNKPYEPKQVG